MSYRLLQNINGNSNKVEITDTVEIVDDDDEELPPPQNVQSRPAQSQSQPSPKKLITTFRKVQTSTPAGPSQKTNNNTSTQSAEGGHILLDNDVMVDYDVPMLNASPARVTPPHEKARSSNQNQHNKSQGSASKRNNDEANNEMARVLRANPNISMRQLFEGEEEMGLYAYIPLQHGKKMPDGWFKVATVLQYDEVTKRMFEELERPYGNQSSFLRHLVLLEKYFRNGDLILSHNASTSAQIYSESVQTRLRSYDNIPTRGMRIMQQQPAPSVNDVIPPVTITPSVTILPKPKVTNDTSSASLLKNSQQLTNAAPAPIQQQSTPVSSQQVTKSRQISITNESKPQDILDAASKLIQAEEKLASSAMKKINIPPEITKLSQSEIAISAIPSTSNIRKSPAPSTSISTPTPAPPIPNPAIKPHPQNIIKLPDTLSAQERRQTTGKPWRPTLIPIIPGALSNPPNGPLYQTVDGRKLPSLVQVMSGGKPYHISIHDYNRMCILRREKLLMQNQATLRNKKIAELVAAKKKAEDHMQKLQIPNQILEQNSVIPVPNNNNTKSDTHTNIAGNGKRKSAPTSLLKSNLNTKLTAQQQLQQHILQQQQMFQQQMHMQQNTTQNPSSSTLLIPPISSLISNFSTTITATTTSSNPISSQAQKHPALSNPNLTITTAPPQLPPSIEMIKWVPPISTIMTTSSNVINSENSINITNGGSNSGISMSGNSTSGGSLVLDNSAITVLPKLPKSLTIIPQQKERTRVTSGDDQNN